MKFSLGSIAAAALAGTALGALGTAVPKFARRSLTRLTSAAHDLDDPDFPRGKIALVDLDGSTMGPIVAILEEAYGGDGSGIPPLETSAYDIVRETFSYGEILGSAVETILALVAVIAAETIAHDIRSEDCDDEGHYTTPPGAFIAEMVIVLETAARSFERAWADHITSCRWCSRADDAAPTKARARLCLDLADDLAHNADSDDIVINGASIDALIDVTSFFVTLASRWTGLDAADQVRALSETVTHLTATDELPDFSDRSPSPGSDGP